MANTVSTKTELVLVGAYNDGSERITTINNPKANITEEEINTLGTLNASNQIQKGFNHYKSATRRTITTTDYDIS